MGEGTNRVRTNWRRFVRCCFRGCIRCGRNSRTNRCKSVPAGQTPISRRELAERIIADALPVRFQLQMHKIIWPPDQRGV